MLSHAINHQLTNWLGLRVVRVKAHDNLMAQAAGQMRPLANSPLAVERISRLGRLLRPQQARGVKKLRLGALNDCGYVCLDDFAGLEAALSLGIAAEVSWDAEMADRGLVVYQYDHTVEGPPYPHANFRFHRRKIGARAGHDSESIESALARAHLTQRHSAILKIDIDDDEWPAFAATSAATLDVFTQVLAELHGFNNVLDDDWFEQALAVLAKLNEKFAVVHVHANNYRPLLAIGNVLFPEVLEVTYASRAKYSFTDCDEVFPGPLDSPNWPAAPDYGLGKFVY
jgi:hypothetical protein